MSDWKSGIEGKQIELDHHRPPTGQPSGYGSSEADPNTCRTLIVKELTVRFGSTEAVNNVSLNVEPGDVLGLVGESGSGKTTLCRGIAGVLPSSSRVTGSVLVSGHISTLKRTIGNVSGPRIGYVFQSPDAALNPCLRIETQLTEHLRAQGMNPSDAHNRARAMLQRMRISNPDLLMHRYPHEISGGQRQRICIAIALLFEPDLLIFDEPTTNLDVTTQAAILNLIREVLSSTSIPLPSVYVSHDLAVVGEVASHIAVMCHGEIVETGTVGEVLGNPLHPYTRALLASKPDISSRFVGAPPMVSNEWVTNIHDGCRYAYRCPLAEEACLDTAISLVEVTSTGHYVRCKRMEDTYSILIQRHIQTIEGEKPPGIPYLVGRNISVSFGFGRTRVSALSNIDLELKRRWTVGIVGESGAGKTTLARVIAGLIRPNTGEIYLDEKHLSPSVEQRSLDQLSKIQMVFQSATASLNPQRTVRSILDRQVRRLGGVDHTRVRDRVMEVLHEVQLSKEFLDRYPNQLSGGEKQRVAIARALAARPIVYLLDEAVSSLDVSVQAAILALLQDLRERPEEPAFLYISHDLATVAGFVDEMIVFYSGKVLEHGPVREILNGPHHPYTEVLLRSVPGEIALTSRAIKTLEMPVLANAGCVFASRCPWRIGPICEETEPPLKMLSPLHKSRCHYDGPELITLAKSDREKAKKHVQ